MISLFKQLKDKIVISKSNIHLFFYASLFVYILGISIYLIVSYYNIHKEINEEINLKLQKAANSLEYLLPINYHDRATHRKAINEIEFSEIMQLLSNHASNLGVKYIYSMVESNGKFYFTTSSATSYELKTGQNLTYYWQEYTEVNQKFFEALKNYKTTYIDYTDRWGTFRSVLIPKTSPTGNKYLLCADIETSYIDKKIWNNIFLIILKAIFFTLIIVPFFLIFYKYHKLSKEQFSKKLSEKELKALYEQDLRKESFKKYQQLEEKYSLLFEYSTIPIIVIDKQGKIIETSEAFLDFIGKKNTSLHNHIIFTIPFFQSVNDFEKLISLTQEKKIVQNYSINLFSKKGEVECSVWSFMLEKHSKDQFMIIIQDSSIERKYIQELAKAKLFSEELKQRKSLFISNLSHEMRTPLNVIIGFIDILKEDNLDKATKDEYLHIIQSNAEHLLLLINDVIDFSKIEAGQFVLKESYCNINFMLRQFKKWMEEEVKQKKVPVEIKLNLSLADGDDVIYADKLRLKQVLTNFINNALKFTSEGFIEIGYKIINTDIEFFVKDTGPGLTEDDKKILFNEYSQGVEGKKSKYKGSGLGLSISKRIIEIMGGSINVISNLNEGSYFYFTIPYKKISHVKAENNDINWSGLTFIVADQDKSSSELINRILLSYKANAILINDFSELIQVIENNKDIKFVILDMDFSMPNVSQFITYVKKKLSIKLIGISSNIYLINVNKANNIGFDAMLAKPFTRKELEQAIEQLL